MVTNYSSVLNCLACPFIYKHVVYSYLVSALMYFLSIEVCQIVEDNYPAGSQDSSFSVDSEGNVVISYGGTTGSDGKTRYLSYYCQ